jgi:hypothetical protein
MAHATAKNSVSPIDLSPESCGFLATATEPVAPRYWFGVPNHLLPQTFYQLCMVADSILLTLAFPDNGPRRGQNLESSGARNLNPLTDPNPRSWVGFTLPQSSSAAAYRLPLIGAAFAKDDVALLKAQLAADDIAALSRSAGCGGTADSDAPAPPKSPPAHPSAPPAPRCSPQTPQTPCASSRCGRRAGARPRRGWG